MSKNVPIPSVDNNKKILETLMKNHLTGYNIYTRIDDIINALTPSQDYNNDTTINSNNSNVCPLNPSNFKNKCIKSQSNPNSQITDQQLNKELLSDPISLQQKLNNEQAKAELEAKKEEAVTITELLDIVPQSEQPKPTNQQEQKKYLQKLQNNAIRKSLMPNNDVIKKYNEKTNSQLNTIKRSVNEQSLNLDKLIRLLSDEDAGLIRNTTNDIKQLEKKWKIIKHDL